MTDIKLKELPKSKEFMKQVKYKYPETFSKMHDRMAPLMKKKAIKYEMLTNKNNPSTIEMLKYNPARLRDEVSTLSFEMSSMLHQLNKRAQLESLDITLDELSESDEFIEQVMKADKATRLTEREHGFQFCRTKHKGEIIFGPMCIGDYCSLRIDEKNSKCPKFSHTFHTHPTIGFQQKSMWSHIDFTSIAASSNLTNAPRIGCVKSILSDEIWCEKMHIADNDLMEKLISINKTPIAKSEFDTRQQADEAMFTLARSTATSIPIKEIESLSQFEYKSKKSKGLVGLFKERKGE